MAISKNQVQNLKDKMDNTFVEKYQPVIDKVLANERKIRRDTKEDLAQECYIDLLERQSELGGSDDIEKATMICRTVVQKFRRSRKRGDEKDMIKMVSADIPNIARQLAKIGVPENQDVDDLHEAIETLEPGVRQVIRSMFVTGYTRKETAEVLGLSDKAVRWRMKKGIEALKKYFEAEPQETEKVI
jgi:RNA polymerase sigma factor (sigma-70 family)